MFKVMSNQYHKGFQMMFRNGWTVSVQFGKTNYADNPNHFDESEKAEIAAWDENGNWYKFEDDTVKGWCEPNLVAAFMSMIAEKE